MRCVIQRVREASVCVDENIAGSIRDGFLIYLAIAPNDTDDIARRMVFKIMKLRLFEDDQGKMNLSLLDKKLAALVVSQFTLYADCSQGNRPFYGNVAKPEEAARLCALFVSEFRKQAPCETGIFGARMRVHSVNDGPVTIVLDSEKI